MHKSPKVCKTIAIRTAKLESREVIRLEEEGLQTKIFNERRFSPARHGRKLFIFKILFSKLLALPQKNVNIWDLQKTRLWLKADVFKGYLLKILTIFEGLSDAS